MGGGQPYLYGPPQAYNQNDPYGGFNPKAITQAYNLPPRPNPKQNGPLVNFNAHPDGFAIASIGATQYTHLHPNTKNRVTRVRRSQLAFRCVQLVAAVGLLVAVFCIKKTKSTEGWMIRAPPVGDVILSLYAIHHLVRRQKDRTPSTSAVYHMFAMVMDATLITLYVFITLLGRGQEEMRPNTSGRWLSIFDSDDSTAQLISALWIVGVTCGGLHVFSLFMDIYLIIMYRKISALPPDLNPLEEKKDNLTRRKTKHKYKNSEVTLVDDEKRFSDMSGSTIGTLNRMSFLDSRDNRESYYSPRNLKSTPTNTSRASMYQQPNDAVSSRVHIGSHQRNKSFVDAYPEASRFSPMPNNPISPKRNTGGSIVSSLHTYHTTPSSSQASISTMHDKEQNYFSIGDETDDQTQTDYVQVPSHSPYSPQPRRHHLQEITNLANNAGNLRAPPQYTQEPQHPPREFSSTNPLRMNPPTPPPQPIIARNASKPISPHVSTFNATSMPFTTASSNLSSSYEESERSRTMLSTLTSSSAYSNEDSQNITGTFGYGGVKSVGAPKSKFYGDLASAMRGVRHQVPEESRPKSMVGSVHYLGDEGRARQSMLSSVSGTIVRKDIREEDEENEYDDQFDGYANGAGYGRVISRSGVDILETTGDLGMRGRRDVSGKVAEEGRGGPPSGGWFGSGILRRVSRKH